MNTHISKSSKIYDSIFKAKEILDILLDIEYKDALGWIKDIVENPKRNKMNKCEICEHSDGKLELHHVRGIKHGNETITTCQECHKILTYKQNSWDSSWLDPNAVNKDAFLIRGLIDICELKYEKTGKEIYKLIAEELTRGFSYD